MTWTWVLIVLTVLSLWPTTRTLIDAHTRCRRLNRLGENGLLKRDCEYNRRREMWRLTKHGLLTFGVVLAFMPPELLPWGLDRIHVRSAIMVIVSWMLSYTSVADRHHTHRLEEDLRRREVEVGAGQVQT
jgi:hypothetical protein